MEKVTWVKSEGGKEKHSIPAKAAPGLEKEIMEERAEKFENKLGKVGKFVKKQTKRRIEEGVKLTRFLIKDKLKYRKLFKPKKQVTIELNQPVVTQDRSRFFKETWDEEKRLLFFK